MTRIHSSLGLVLVSVLAACLIVGCSDDKKPTPNKPSAADAGKKAAPKTPETKPEEKKEIAPEAKTEVKPEAKPQAVDMPKAEAKLETKVEVKEVKAEVKPEGKVEVKAEPEAKPQAKDMSKPEAKVEVKEVKPEAKREAKDAPKPETPRESAPSAATGDSALPKFSTFAPAEDLAAELKLLIVDLEKAVVNEDEFKSQVEGRFTRDGNTITLIAIALGLHDQDNPVKANAKAIAAAAQHLAQMKSFADTKKAVEDIKAAAEGQGKGAMELKWGKVSQLIGLMKDEVPAINNKIKTGLRRFAKRKAEVSANAAAMALIAENSLLYVGDTKKPTEGKKWIEFSNQMRAAAVDLAIKARAGDEPGAKAAMEKLDKSCHDCHAVFNPEEKK